MSGTIKTVGVTIAGVGDAGLVVAGRELRFSTIERDVGGSKYYVPQLEAWPRRIRTETEPLEGLTTQGTIDVALSDLDRADSLGSNYGSSVLNFFWATRLVAQCRLTANLTAAATVIPVEVLGGQDQPVAGSIMFIGREALYISSVSGSPVTSMGATRGVLGTEALVHDERDPFLYASNNLPIDREVVLYDLDMTTDTETVRMRGIVENFQLTSDLKTISVSCRDLLGRLGDRVLGENRYEGTAYVSFYPNLQSGGDGNAYNLDDHSHVVDYKPIYADNDGSVGYGGFKVTAVEIDGHAVLVRMTESVNPVRGSWGYLHPFAGGAHARNFDGRVLDPGDKGKEYRFRQILHADANEPHSLFRDFNGVQSDHPADIIRCILQSSGTATWPQGASHTVGSNGPYDWLSKPWGLNVHMDDINDASFDEIKQRYPTRGLRFRNFYLGHGDENPKALEVLFDLAQAANCYIYLDEFNRIAIKYFSDPGKAGIDAALTPDDILYVKGAASGVEGAPLTLESVYALRIETCAQGPGGKPAQTILASDFDQAAVARFRYLAKEDKLESTHVYGDPQTHSLSQTRLARIGHLFAPRFRYQQGRLPVYDIQTVPGAPFVTSGMFIEITHPAFFDLDHTRGVVEHRCLVLSADWSPEKDTQQIRVVDWSPASTFTKSIAPSFQVATPGTSTQFLISNNYFTGSDAVDESFWIDETAGDYFYTLWSADGVRLSANEVEGTITGAAVVLATAWVDAPFAVPIIPATGDIIRARPWVSTSDWYTDADHAFFGDADAELDATPTLASDWSI